MSRCASGSSSCMATASCSRCPCSSSSFSISSILRLWCHGGTWARRWPVQWRLPWASCPARQVPHGTQETGTRTSCVRHGCGTLWLRVNTVSRMMPSSLAWSEAMTSCVPGSMRNSRNLTSNAGSAEPPTMPTILRNRLRPTALLLLGRPAEGARRRSVVQSRARVIYKRARTPSASDLPAEQWAPR